MRGTPSLVKLLAKARALDELNATVSDFLGAPLNHHCHVANIDDDVVVIHADSPVWSARLRYRIPDVLEHLRRNDSSRRIGRAKIGVRPTALRQAEPTESGLANATASGRPRMSGDTARLIRSVADGSPDSNLSRVLLRIAKHGAGPGSRN